MVLLVLQDSRVEGPLLPLLRGQGDLTAEPPREEGPDSGCTGGSKCPHLSSAALTLRPTGGDAPVGGFLEPQPALLHLPVQLGW